MSSATVQLDDLLAVFDWVSSSAPAVNDAFVSRVSGKLHWSSDDVELDDELPQDIDDGTLYVAVPHRFDLNLGKGLALAFAGEQLSDSFEMVADAFRKRGAYARFKEVLERRSLLQAWYDYEIHATEDALRGWAVKQGLSLAGGARRAQA